MQSNLSRRTLAKGAAWATPLAVATASIPAYAASSTTPPVVSCGDEYAPDVFFNDALLAKSSIQTQVRQSIGTTCYSLPVGTVVTVSIVNTGTRSATYKASTSTTYNLNGPSSPTSLAAGSSATITFTTTTPVAAGSMMGVFTQYESKSSFSVTYTVELPAGYSDPADSNNVATYNI